MGAGPKVRSQLGSISSQGGCVPRLARFPYKKSWVAVKELKLSYYSGEIVLVTIYIYTHYGDLIKVPSQHPRKGGPKMDLDRMQFFGFFI